MMKSKSFNKILGYLFIISSSVLLSTCQKDEISMREFPRLDISDDIHQNESGVTFTGNIITEGSSKILDKGFVWHPIAPSISFSRISLGEHNGIGQFEATAQIDLLANSTYIVKAFIITEDYLVYSKAIQFDCSFTSPSPQIIDFNPKQAKWNDTIQIQGQNFSYLIDKINILFGEVNAHIISCSDTTILVIVPDKPNNSSIPIKAKVYDNTAVSIENFNYIIPKAKDFYPKNGTFLDTLTITGQDFPYSSKYCFVKVGEINTSIVENSSTQIKVIIPNEISSPKSEIVVNIMGINNTFTEMFILNPPIINLFSPSSGTFGEEISIQGNNFSTISSYNSVWLGDIEATITKVDSNKLKFLIPNSLVSEKSQIIVKVKEQTAFSVERFSLLHPKITSLSPNTGSFGDVITISGQNFNPISANNIVKFGDTIVSVIESTKNELKVKVPNNYYSENGKLKIKVEVGELSGSSDEYFELNLHSIESFSPLYGSRGDTIVVSGDNFNTVPEYNSVFIGETKSEIISSSKTSIVLKVDGDVTHGEQLIKVKIAGREVSSVNKYQIYEPWIKLSDFPGSSSSAETAIRFAINGKGYAGKGGDFWEYDPISNLWTKKEGCPYWAEGFSSFSTETKGYFVVNKALWQYDPTADVWAQKANYPGDARIRLFAFGIGTKGYVGTGVSEPYTSTCEFWEYDEVTDSWSQKPNYPGDPSSNGSAFAIGNKGYFVFGNRNNDLWEYNTLTNLWSKKINLNEIVDRMSTHIRYLGIAFSINGKGYFGMGSATLRSNTCSDLYEYDPVSNSCKRVGNMSVKRTFPIGFSINNKGYIGLGKDDKYNYLMDFWEFDPAKTKP